MKKLSLTAFTLAALLLAAPLHAADKPTKTTAQVKSDLYVTATEAYDLLQQDKTALLIDVRDPIEVMFTGFTDEADIHVPYMISDRTQKHAKKPSYAMKKNENFFKEVSKKLEEMKISKDTKLIFMCRSGSNRSAPAADMFYEAGFKNAYTIVDGFEGSPSKEGKSKGVRDVNGWRNSGLPWSYNLNPDKMYFSTN
ncbi:rhodanese-like domain-containing protein [Terasakiella pusilla]|uniref:rhodanese-like domain-containing protein n=1 Tax=Terasakiella pusilla TaxID=64973 RepID=UPI003AA974F3